MRGKSFWQVKLCVWFTMLVFLSVNWYLCHVSSVLIFVQRFLHNLSKLEAKFSENVNAITGQESRLGFSN